MGQCTLHNGPVYTTQWDSVHYTMGQCTLHNGTVYTAQWDSVHCTMGQCTLHSAEFLCLQLTIQNYDLSLKIDVFVFQSMVGTTVNIPLNLKI